MFEEKVAAIKEDVNEFLDNNSKDTSELKERIRKNSVEHLTKLAKSIIE